MSNRLQRLRKAQLMVIMGTSIMDLALPGLQTDLGFTPGTSRGSSAPTSSPVTACCCSAATDGYSAAFLGAAGIAVRGTGAAPRRC